MKRKAGETAAEKDERIVREAIKWCGRWSFEAPPFEGLCQQFENYNLMRAANRGIFPARKQVFHAAARILNRIARARGRKGK